MADFTIFLNGAAGGAVLAGVVCFMTLNDLVRSHERRDRKMGQFVAAQLVSITLLAAIGGTTSWAFTGRAGDFITGLTALGFVLLIAGDRLVSPEKNLGYREGSQ